MISAGRFDRAHDSQIDSGWDLRTLLIQVIVPRNIRNYYLRLFAPACSESWALTSRLLQFNSIRHVGGDFGSGRRQPERLLLTAHRGSRSFEERQLRSYQGRGHGANRRPPSVKRPFRALGEQQVANGQPRDRK